MERTWINMRMKPLAAVACAALAVTAFTACGDDDDDDIPTDDGSTPVEITTPLDTTMTSTMTPTTTS